MIMNTPTLSTPENFRIPICVVPHKCFSCGFTLEIPKSPGDEELTHSCPHCGDTVEKV